MNKSERPHVTVTNVMMPVTCDIVYCSIKVGDHSFVAPFGEHSSKLCGRVFNETGVELSDSELTLIERAARTQMNTESGRMSEVLKRLPAGTVAELSCRMHFYWNSKDQFVWVEGVEINTTAGFEVYPSLIEEVGDIGAQDTNEIILAIRSWLLKPTTIQADIEWIKAADEQNS